MASYATTANVRRRIPLVAVILGCAIVFPAHPTLSAADEPVLFIRMPDEAPAANRPADADIDEFIAARKAQIDTTLQELSRDKEFARQVLGQNQIFQELNNFQKQFSIPARVKFIAWADALRYFNDYVSDATNPPAAVQLGDTWAAYFRQLGVVAYEKRHTWDVRMLWYWKDMVDPEGITDGAGFAAACNILRDKPPPGLIAPFAIPTSPDWDLLHNLSIWLYSAGVSDIITTDKKFWLFPWKEAAFAGSDGESAVRFLIDLVERGYLVLPDKTNVEVTEDFLARRYAMIIMPPWVASRAEGPLGPGWQSRVGTAMPPKIGATVATTFKGGSLLVVLDPSRGKKSDEVARARQLVDYLCSEESQRQYTQALGALPANPQALEQSPYYPMFKVAIEEGKTYPELAEWAPVVENLATRDNLYAFWKRLSALTDKNLHTTGGSFEQTAREKLVIAALHTAEADINKEMSPGKLASSWRWIVAVVVLGISIPALYWRHRYLERQRIRELREERVKLAKLQRSMAFLEDARSEVDVALQHLHKP